jgi:hypothetical protein
MLLSDTRCRQTKPAGRVGKLRDGEGLFLHVEPGSARL